MNELFLSYNLSLLMKEIGFDEPCFNYYDNDNEDIKDKNFYLNKWGCPLGITTSQLRSNKGFDECIAAPLYDQVIQWFIDKHGIEIVSFYNPSYNAFTFRI